MLPNVRLSGENNNLIYHLSKVMTMTKTLVNEAEKDGPWAHNDIPKQAMSCPIQRIIETMDIAPKAVVQDMFGSEGESLRIEEQKKILGTKTIRIQIGDWTPLEASDFFKEYFPCSKIIVNIRLDIEKQAQSGWWKTLDATEILRQENDFLQKFSKHLGHNMSKTVDMAEWTTNITKLNDVVYWLGYKNCNFPHIFHENKQTVHDHDESVMHLDKKCQYIGK